MRARTKLPTRICVLAFRGGNSRTRPSTFTQANLELAFGGVLRHFRLEGSALHDDKDARTLTVLTDDERPVVFYGEQGAKAPAQQPTEPDKADAQ